MKMKRLLPIILVVLLLVPAAGWAAVYYLSLSGSATPPYDTWEKAANNIKQILDLPLTGSNTIYVAPGEYLGQNNYIYLNDPKYSNLSIIGVSSPVNTLFFPGSSYHALYAKGAISNLTIKNISLKCSGTKSAAYLSSGASNIFFENVILYGDDSHAATLFITYGTNTLISKCEFFDAIPSTVYSSAIKFGDDASGRISYSLVSSKTGLLSIGILVDSTGEVSIENCIITKAARAGILKQNTGSLNIYNSLVNGTCAEWDQYPIYGKAGTLNVYNTFVNCSPRDPNLSLHGVSASQNILKGDPRIFSTHRIGYIIPCVDDRTNLSYAVSLASILAKYGYKGTWFTYTHSWNPSDNAIARSLVSGGVMEVAAHSYSHTSLDYTHALHFSYSGSDSNPTVAFQDGQIQLRTSEGNDNVDIDTTSSENDEIGEIISNFNGVHNWTISKSTTDGQIADHISDFLKATSLAEMTTTAAPCDIDMAKSDANCSDGCSGFYNDEIVQVKSQLENIVNGDGNIIDPQTGRVYSCRTFAYPYNAYDDNVATALRTAGFIGARGIGRAALRQLNIYNVWTLMANKLVVRGDEEATKLRAEEIASSCCEAGYLLGLLAHNDSEVTMEEWQWIFEGIQHCRQKVTVTSFQLACDAIKKLGNYNPETGFVAVTWSATGDYHLSHNSPCIDAGIKLPIHDNNWQDLAGNMIHYGRAPDIGAYEAITDVATAWGMLPWYGRKYCLRW